MSNISELQRKVASLSEPLAAEVLDFLEFVVAKSSRRSSPTGSSAGRFRGAFKGRLSSSAAFAAAKMEEIRLEQ